MSAKQNTTQYQRKRILFFQFLLSNSVSCTSNFMVFIIHFVVPPKLAYAKLQKQPPGGVPESCNFIKQETLAQLFSCEFCKILRTTFLIENLRLLLLRTAANIYEQLNNFSCYLLFHNPPSINLQHCQLWLFCFTFSNLSILIALCEFIFLILENKKNSRFSKQQLH